MIQTSLTLKFQRDPIDKFLWTRMQHAASYNMGEVFQPGGYITDWYTEESLKVIRGQ